MSFKMQRWAVILSLKIIRSKQDTPSGDQASLLKKLPRLSSRNRGCAITFPLSFWPTHVSSLKQWASSSLTKEITGQTKCHLSFQSILLDSAIVILSSPIQIASNKAHQHDVCPNLGIDHKHQWKSISGTRTSSITSYLRCSKSSHAYKTWGLQSRSQHILSIFPVCVWRCLLAIGVLEQKLPAFWVACLEMTCAQNNLSVLSIIGFCAFEAFLFVPGMACLWLYTLPHHSFLSNYSCYRAKHWDKYYNSEKSALHFVLSK